jgi:putative spermidine/putrescine transport system permease protein
LNARNNWESLVIALPGILLISGFFIVPMLQILWLSFSHPTLGVQNYEMLVESEGLRTILITTFKLCILTTIICCVLGYIVSYALVQASERQLYLMMFLILVPLWLSVLVRAFAWLIILRQNGLINSALLSLGLTTGPLPLSYSQGAVLVGMVHFMLPYAILPIYANMREIDGQFVRAARSLGASPGAAFRRIFLPLSTSGIIYAASLVFILSLGFYIVPFLLGGGRVTMIASFIAVNMLDTGNWGLSSMLSVVLLIITLSVFGLSRWIIAKRTPDI